MLARLAATLPLLLLPQCALAQEDAAPELTTLDHLTMVTLGIADGATILVLGSELATATREGPGQYRGTLASDGAEYTLTMTETEPCLFDGAFGIDGELFELRIHADRIQSFTFLDAEPGPADGLTTYLVEIDGPVGAIETKQDGEYFDGGQRSPIGTTVALADLEAAAAAVLAACPVRA